MKEALRLGSPDDRSPGNPRREALLYWMAAVSTYVAATAYCAKFAPWVSSIANSPILFALAPFVVGVLMWQTVGRAVLIGCLSCLTMVGLFYGFDDLSGANPMNWQGLRVYAAQAVAVGPACAAVGAGAMRLRGRTRICALIGVPVAILVWQVRNVAVPDASSQFDDATLLANALVWCAAAVVVSLSCIFRFRPLGQSIGT